MNQPALFTDDDVQTEGYAQPEPRVDDSEAVTFEHEGRQLTGTVISWYTAPSGQRVTVALPSGAVFSLAADSVTPSEAEAA